MMDIFESFEIVTHSDGFNKWQKKNKEAFLCSFFRVIGGENDDASQVDFYNEKKDAISSFVVEDGIAVLKLDNVEVFKKKDEKVIKLNLSDVKVSEAEALSKVKEIQKLKYKNENITKFIIILQCKKSPRWNISSITSSLKVINIKIDAGNADILEETIANLLSFAKKDE